MNTFMCTYATQTFKKMKEKKTNKQNLYIIYKIIKIGLCRCLFSADKNETKKKKQNKHLASICSHDDSEVLRRNHNNHYHWTILSNKRIFAFACVCVCMCV